MSNCMLGRYDNRFSLRQMCCTFFCCWTAFLLIALIDAAEWESGRPLWVGNYLSLLSLGPLMSRELPPSWPCWPRVDHSVLLGHSAALIIHTESLSYQHWHQVVRTLQSITRPIFLCMPRNVECGFCNSVSDLKERQHPNWEDAPNLRVWVQARWLDRVWGECVLQVFHLFMFSWCFGHGENGAWWRTSAWAIKTWAPSVITVVICRNCDVSLAS